MSKEKSPHQGKVVHPLWKNVVAGGTAGIMEVLCMYPTDVVKTRQQLGKGKTVGMIQQFRDIIRLEGFGNLYRGIASPILAEAPKRAIKFSLNEKYKQSVRKKDGSLPGSRAALAGALAGMTECSVNTPFEVIKVQMQAKENLGRYTGIVHCVQSLVRTEGILSLYKGVESQLWRNAVWNGVYFGMIGGLKENLLKAPEGSTRRISTLYDFGAGVVGGTLATLANTPFDVVKSRMQNQLKEEGGSLKYKWTLPSLTTILNEEGWGALYKGIGPRLVRLGPGGGIMLVAFNYVIEFLKDF
jgi:solute carrier family 25 2-oxodicarboxylate transporter 21